MIYLVTKIAVLVLLAALLGIWFGRWTVSRKFRDVTEEFHRMLNLSPEKPAVDGQVMRALHDIFERLPAPGQNELVQRRLDRIEAKLVASNVSAAGRAPTTAELSQIESMVPRATPRQPAVQNLLVDAAHGPKDRLQKIDGIGPKIELSLNELGVYYFWQIAQWGPAEIEQVDASLESFRGRIQRDDWVRQAKLLAAQTGAAKAPGTQASPPPLANF